MSSALSAWQEATSRHLYWEPLPGDAIGDLPSGQQEGERTAELVSEGVDLRRAPTARAADGLVLLPPLPPAAQR